MTKRKLWTLRGTGLTLSVAMIVFGLMRGEQLEVLKKAVDICLQCIGIG